MWGVGGPGAAGLPCPHVWGKRAPGATGGEPRSCSETPEAGLLERGEGSGPLISSGKRHADNAHCVHTPHTMHTCTCTCALTCMCTHCVPILEHQRAQWGLAHTWAQHPTTHKPSPSLALCHPSVSLPDPPPGLMGLPITMAGVPRPLGWATGTATTTLPDFAATCHPHQVREQPLCPPGQQEIDDCKESKVPSRTLRKPPPWSLLRLRPPPKALTRVQAPCAPTRAPAHPERLTG